jgi:hypothetical protein
MLHGFANVILSWSILKTFASFVFEKTQPTASSRHGVGRWPSSSMFLVWLRHSSLGVPSTSHPASFPAKSASQPPRLILKKRVQCCVWVPYVYNIFSLGKQATPPLVQEHGLFHEASLLESRLPGSLIHILLDAIERHFTSPSRKVYCSLS